MATRWKPKPGVVRWVNGPSHTKHLGSNSTQTADHRCGCTLTLYGGSKLTQLGLCAEHAATYREGFVVIFSPIPPFALEDVRIRKAHTWQWGDEDETYLCYDNRTVRMCDTENITWFPDLPDERDFEDAWIQAWLKLIWQMGPTTADIARRIRQREPQMYPDMERLSRVLMGELTPIEAAADLMMSTSGKKQGSGAMTKLGRAVRALRTVPRLLRLGAKPPKLSE